MPFALAFTGFGGAGKSSAATCAFNLTRSANLSTALVIDDYWRPKLAPPGTNPFPATLEERFAVCRPVNEMCLRLLDSGKSVILDAAMSREPTRAWFKEQIPGLKLVWIDCPLPLAMMRETWRSVRDGRHDRDTFLYARAIGDRLFRPRGRWRHMPPVTGPFDPPVCADLRISSLLKSPDCIAREALGAVGVTLTPGKMEVAVCHHA